MPVFGADLRHLTEKACLAPPSSSSLVMVVMAMLIMVGAAALRNRDPLTLFMATLGLSYVIRALPNC